MFSSIFFIFSFLLLLISLLLMYKKNDKLDILVHIIIDFIFVTIINSSIIFVMSFCFNLKSSLLFRSVIFIAISFLIILKIIRNKKIQKYKFNKVNAIFALIIIIFSTYVGLRRFGSNIDLVFETTDPAVHLLSAQRFSESDKLIENSQKDYAYGGSKEGRGLFYSYTTLGTVLEVEDGLGGNFYNYVKTFIITELFFFVLIGLSSFYLIVSYVKKSKILKEILLKILSLIVVVLMVYAYPYNSMIFGFHYINIFLLFSILILLLFKEYSNDYLNKNFILYLSLYNFYVFATYYMFVPVIFGAEGVYYLYLCFINKKYKFREICKIIVITLVIPFIIGMFYYFISPRFYKSSGSGTSPFKAEGYIYRNLMGSIILLVPAFLISTIKQLKNKKIELLNLTILFEFLFMFLIFYFLYKGNAASYYFYKNYYYLSPILYIDLGIIICNKDDLYDMGIALLFLILFSFIIYKTNIEDRLRAKNALINPISYTSGLIDIYTINDIKENEKPIFYDNELKDLVDITSKYKNEFNYNNFFYYSPSLLKRLWCYDAIRIPYTPKYKKLNDFYLELKPFEEIIKYNDLKYVLVGNNEEINLEKLVLLEQNNSFKIYEVIE